MFNFILYKRGGIWQSRVCEFQTIRQAAGYILANPEHTEWGLWDKGSKTWVHQANLYMIVYWMKAEDLRKKKVNWKQEGF